MATMSLPGVFEADFSPNSFLIMAETGGSLVMKVNDLSSKTVITAGIMFPFSSRVLSLYCLTNYIIGTPCWPKAGPTGGAGVASPAGKFNFIRAFIFLAAIFISFLPVGSRVPPESLFQKY